MAAPPEERDPRITKLQEQDEVELISVSSGPELTAIRQGNGKHPPQYRPDQYFRDGRRKIDFVLVRSSDLPPSQHAHDARQEIFESNLRKEGLELEEEQIDENSPLTFIKIHTPWEVLRRYAEILKIRMPMKLPAGISKDEDFIKKVPVLREITDLVDTFDKTMFGVNPKKFPPKNQSLTGVYSRDREYLL